MAATVGINVVFTDLVGSTEMSNRLGPEATEALRVIHFGLLRGAMEAHGGIEVKNLGDGLMIVFPSLGAALDGSVAMQQAIERHNTSGKEALGIRVGISTGDATEEDGDYFGEPVVEAARLCAKCDAGQIITSELISVMAKRSGHAFESIGDLDLRGVPEPVASVSVLWEPLQIAGEVPMPDRLRPDMEQRIAGRARESDALAQAFKSAEAGQRRLILLAGEPGIGKTRLASELASYAHGRGAVVLYGRCDEELSLPYQPWVEAIGYLLESSDSETVKTALDLHGPELATLVPQLRRRFPDLAASTSTDAETERYMLLQAVTGCLSLLGADTPVLLVLDDLHWADKQTLTMLRHVLTNMAAASLMIVVTYRDSDLGSGHPLTDTVAALRRETGVELINVMGLDDLEMVQLVEISAGHELDDDARNMALMLRQETAGNPFFAHEILRNLVEHGDLYFDEATGRWVVAKTFEELALPQSVRDVVGQRIARLGEEPLKTLSTAAIIGREFDLDLLADVTGIDEDDLLDQLDLATAAGVLVEVPGSVERFRFPHTLARSTLAADLSEGRRRRIHRKVAESLEASIGDAPGGRAGELATHWLAAAVSVDVAKATRYARLAGQHAQAALAPDEAIRWFTAALENLELADEPDDLERARLLVDLGMAQKDASEPAYRQTLLDAGALAEQIGDSSLMATAAIANSRGFTSKLGFADKERIDALDRALTAIGAGATAERAMLLATLISELEYHSTFEDRMARYDEAISIAREVGDPATLAFVLNRLCVSLAVPQTLELRRDASVEACALADELGDVTLRFWSQCGAYTYAVGSGDPAAADAELEELTETARASGRASLRWIAGYLRGSLLSFRGDATAMEQRAGENFALAMEAGEPDALDYFGAALLTTRWYQGRVLELIEQVDQAVVDNPAISTYRAIPPHAYAEAGDHDRASRLLRSMNDEGFDTIMVNNLWSTTLSLWAMVAVMVEDRDAAATLYGLLLPCSGQVSHNRSLTPYAIDSVLAHLATVLGDHEQAGRHFDSAEVLLELFGADHAIATDRLGRASLHAAIDGDGDRQRALDLASETITLAQEHGYASLERMAGEFRSSLGGS